MFKPLTIKAALWVLIALLVIAMPSAMAEGEDFYDPDAFEAPMINITSDAINIPYEELLDADMQPSTELDSGGFESIMSYTGRDELPVLKVGQTIELRFQTEAPDECVAYEYILGEDGSVSSASGAVLSHSIAIEGSKGAWDLVDLAAVVVSQGAEGDAGTDADNGPDDAAAVNTEGAVSAEGEAGEVLHGIVLRCRFGEHVCAYIFTFVTGG